MLTKYVISKYGKTREDSLEFQKYQLESEIEKKRFAYESALYEQKVAQRRMRDFWQNVQISGLWAFGALFFPSLAIQLERVLRIAGILSWTVCPFLVIWALICFLYTLKKIKFGFSYKERKQLLEQADILVGSQALELHKLELDMEKYSASLVESVSKEEGEENLEVERERKVRQGQMHLQLIRIQIDRAKEVKKSLENELENIMEEENILTAKEQRYRRVLIGSVVGEGMGLVFLGAPGNFIPVACNAWCLLLPPFVIFPILCLWLRAKMELSVGEDLWCNQVLFSFLHENSFQKKRESVTEKILQQQKKIDRLEQEKNEKSTNYIKNVTGN